MERYDLPADQLANEQEAGALRIASETDEKNCGCNDAGVTPKNLYSLLDYRKASTAYTAGVIVACPYHKEFLLKCTTGGTTSANSIDTKAVTKGSVITDGGVKWTVIASQIIDLSISGKTITVTFVDGTQKTLTTQDTTYTAGTGLSLSSNKFSLASAYSKPIADASISGKTITLTFADGTTKTLTTQDTAPFSGSATSLGGANATNPAVIVDTYQSETTWYRKYSDGWVEQGGKITTTGTVTVTLPVAMDSEEYHVALGYNYGTTLDARAVDTRNRTATGFQVPMGSSANLYVYWTVIGKAA